MAGSLAAKRRIGTSASWTDRTGDVLVAAFGTVHGRRWEKAATGTGCE
jgi:hypothetical protein